MRNKKINITEKVMKKIKNEKITMRPKWYFWLGSAILFIAIVSLMIVTVFLISLVTFSLRNRGGPMAIVRYQQIVSNFPWWAVVVSILGLISGITLLKKYDFSYKKNFWLVAGGFVLAVILAGILIDILGFDNIWIRRGPMKKFYQQYRLSPHQYRNQRL